MDFFLIISEYWGKEFNFIFMSSYPVVESFMAAVILKCWLDVNTYITPFRPSILRLLEKIITHESSSTLIPAQRLGKGSGHQRLNFCSVLYPLFGGLIFAEP